MDNDTINRQAAIAYAISGLTREFEGEKWIRVSEVRESLQTMPSAEQHGSWEHLSGDEWFCSACGHVITTEGSWEKPWQKYCEECGARMMNENEEMSKVSEMEMTYAEYLND